MVRGSVRQTVSSMESKWIPMNLFESETTVSMKFLAKSKGSRGAIILQAIFASDGRLYVRHKNTFYGINVDSQVVEREITATENVKKIYDIAYNPVTELHYSIRKKGREAEFISIDLTNGGDEAIVNVINDDFRPVGTFGAMFADANGRVFAANNAGGLYEVDCDSGQATFAGYSPRATSNDGAFSSAAFVDLPPVAANAWISTLVGGPCQ